MDILLLVAVLAVCGISAGKIAEKRHNRFAYFAILGVAFGIFGVLAAWCWPDPEVTAYRQASINAEAAERQRIKDNQARKLAQLARDKDAGRW